MGGSNGPIVSKKTTGRNCFQNDLVIPNQTSHDKFIILSDWFFPQAPMLTLMDGLRSYGEHISNMCKAKPRHEISDIVDLRYRRFGISISGISIFGSLYLGYIFYFGIFYNVTS